MILRVKRVMFQLLLVLSLLLCAATGLFWIRSYRHFDAGGYITRSGTIVGAAVLPHEVIFLAVTNTPALLHQQPVFAAVSHVPRGWMAITYRYGETVDLARYLDQSDAIHINNFKVVIAPPSPSSRFSASSDVTLLPGGSATSRTSQCRVPFWAFLLLFEIGPLLWIYQLLRQYRRKHNRRCVSCGYDLRASSERCPECGSMTHKQIPV